MYAHGCWCLVRVCCRTSTSRRLHTIRSGGESRRRRQLTRIDQAAATAGYIRALLSDFCSNHHSFVAEKKDWASAIQRRYRQTDRASYRTRSGPLFAQGRRLPSGQHLLYSGQLSPTKSWIQSAARASRCDKKEAHFIRYNNAHIRQEVAIHGVLLTRQDLSKRLQRRFVKNGLNDLSRHLPVLVQQHSKEVPNVLQVRVTLRVVLHMALPEGADFVRQEHIGRGVAHPVFRHFVVPL